MRLPDPLARLRLAGLVEGATLLVLVGIAVPLKHAAGLPGAVSLMGPVHGLAFVLYLVTVVENVSGGGWSGREVMRLLVGCLVPFGTLANDPWLRRKGEAARGRAS